MCIVCGDAAPESETCAACGLVESLILERMSADYLRVTIGPRYTAVGLGLSDAAQIDDCEPDRLASLAETVRAIESVYSADTAAAFLISANPDLDDQPPLLAIASGDYAGVRRAVQAFLK